MKTLLGMAILVIGSLPWVNWWWTPDQEGQRLMKRGAFAQAAEAFRDPVWQGVAWFRAGEFERAEQAFARVATAEAEFNRGNCLVMLGEYEAAIARYDRALEERIGWEDALANRDIAVARAKVLEQKGGEMGDQKLGADEIVFDKKESSGGQDTELESGENLSDSAMQALWLRRVQTKPAAFLKAKFAYQLAMGDASGGEGDEQ